MNVIAGPAANYNIRVDAIVDKTVASTQYKHKLYKSATPSVHQQNDIQMAFRWWTFSGQTFVCWLGSKELRLDVSVCRY